MAQPLVAERNRDRVIRARCLQAPERRRANRHFFFEARPAVAGFRLFLLPVHDAQFQQLLSPARSARQMQDHRSVAIPGGHQVGDPIIESERRINRDDAPRSLPMDGSELIEQRQQDQAGQ